MDRASGYSAYSLLIFSCFFGSLLMATPSFAASKGPPQNYEVLLNANTNVIGISDTLVLNWSVPKDQATPSDWIGLFPINTSIESVRGVWSESTQGVLAGSVQVRMPEVPGNYEFRFFSGSSNGNGTFKAKSGTILTVSCAPFQTARSNIKHLVLIVQENHSFDGIFGNYCKAPTGSNPSCNTGPECCEAAPGKDPGTGMGAFLQTDSRNGRYDPNHEQVCELGEMDGGKMDHYILLSRCGNWLENIAYADASTVLPYWRYAEEYAMADRYFQPIAGQSSSNDMYFARAGYVFTDNAYTPAGALGSNCTGPIGDQKEFTEPNIGDMMRVCQVPFGVYAGGYGAIKAAHGGCPERAADCTMLWNFYPCVYDPSDIPFEYYSHLRDNPEFMRDLDTDFTMAVETGTLPSVSYVKTIGYKSEHPGLGVTLSTGVSAVTEIVNKVLNSPLYRDDTLVLVTYDESGGFFDHISPPPESSFDHQPYGPRVPLVAIGNFAKKNFVSHVTMEHSSVVKFIEWNWFSGKAGQLETRDAVVNNIGSLLDPLKTGEVVPE